MNEKAGGQASRRFTVIEVSELIGVERETVIELIEREWIYPVSETELDEEDVARIQLIRDLRSEFGANDDAIPLILHLLDQLYYLRNQMARLKRG